MAVQSRSSFREKLARWRKPLNGLFPGSVELRSVFSIPSVGEMARLRKTLVQLVLIRVMIMTVLLGTSSWDLLVHGAVNEQGKLVFWSIALTFALSIGNLLLIRNSDRLRLIGYIQFSLDVVLSSLVIYSTGSPVGISLYLLVIVAAAVVFNRAGAVIVAALAGLSYAVLASGLLPMPTSHDWRAMPHDILAVYISLVAIALVSGSLAKRLELAGTIATESARSLSQLSKQQRQLFDDISEGIITLDLGSVITSVNQAAKSIAGLSALAGGDIVGKPVSSVLAQWGVNDIDRLVNHWRDSDAPGELTIPASSDSPAQQVNYVSRPLTDVEGNAIGRIIIFKDVSHIRSMEERLTLHETMAKLLAEGDLSTGGRLQHVQIIGESKIMERVFSLVERVAVSDASVLISGESGTGKELVAKAVHAHGPRGTKPFIAVNCGAIPENLIESELFGHKKGSFTGAIADNNGLFRQAIGGTIFLDEIGELPMPMQTKLLRALQERTVRPVGDVKDYPIDVRVLAATNRDLKREIEGGRFREDLYYRLNVVNILVPPLRERKEDIPLLVRYFIGRLCAADAPLPRISPEALQLLLNYDFPGNIRELENTIERALVLGGSAILPEHLPEEINSPSRSNRQIDAKIVQQETQILTLPMDLEGELAKIERQLLLEALSRAGGVKKQAAHLLGLNFRSFRYRLKKYGLSDGNDMGDEAN
jgi:two-component system, NtrC family, response regulator PilR